MRRSSREQVVPPITVTVLAHNEARRIAVCLRSLPLGRADVAIHVAVNGSTDATAAIARKIAAVAGNVVVHDFWEGGKARSWNRLMLDLLPAFSPVVIFVDGDAEVMPGAVDALAAALAAHPAANGVAGFPDNGRRAAVYRDELAETHDIWGDLYALSGGFLGRMKAAGIRLPVDLIGDDGLIGALAKIDLGTLADWDDARVLPCPQARFRCEPVSVAAPRTWRMQYRRMVSYALRHFQNAVVTQILQLDGAAGLPERLNDRIRDAAEEAVPRRGIDWWFDRAALARARHTA